MLDELSFVNLIMYNRILPDYDIDKDKKNTADNGGNLLDLPDEQWQNLIPTTGNPHNRRKKK